MRLKPKLTNVAVRGNVVWGIDDGRSLACLDLDSGDLFWRDGDYGHGQMLLVGDVLLVLAETGEVALVAADEHAYRELARVEGIYGQTWNNPALAGSLLLLRNAEQAACLELPLLNSSPAAH
jgi:outer membrane protein assembly factor BamB